jgi:hypothetical protein
LGLEESSDGGRDSEVEDEEEQEGTRMVWGWTMRGGGDGLASGSALTHRFRRRHLDRPPIAPRDDNKVVIVPCGDE